MSTNGPTSLYSTGQRSGGQRGRLDGLRRWSEEMMGNYGEEGEGIIKFDGECQLFTSQLAL